jgi:hypothetical protein
VLSEISPIWGVTQVRYDNPWKLCRRSRHDRIPQNVTKKQKRLTRSGIISNARIKEVASYFRTDEKKNNRESGWIMTNSASL